jgi:hypothetical protein
MVILRKNGSTEKGASEAIGFMLIFAMVIAGIGLVTLYGYPILLQQQSTANERIMEKNMIVLQNDMKSLAYKTVPYKETSLKIDGGAVTLYGPVAPVTGNITLSFIDSLGNPQVKSFNLSEIRYASVDAQTDISLQNGAVVKRQNLVQGSVMLAEPRWFHDSVTNTMVINLISINSSVPYLARSGIGTFQMGLGETNYTIYSPVNSRIYLDYTPDPTGIQDYTTAWDNYFVHTMKMAPQPDILNPPPMLPTKRYELPTFTGQPATLVIKKYEIMINSF